MAYTDVVNGMTGPIRRRRPVTNPAVNFGDQGSLQTAAQDQYGTESGFGNDATQTYLARAKAFDPQAAVNQYAQGAWGSISDALKNTLKDVRGSAVGAGRYDSGFLDEDQNTVESQAIRDLTNSIAQQSVAASGQTLANNNALGQFGLSTTQDANDLLASEREFQANQAEQRKRNRASKGGAIGGALGTAAGAIRGLVGAGIGGSIGSALGGLF